MDEQTGKPEPIDQTQTAVITNPEYTTELSGSDQDPIETIKPDRRAKYVLTVPLIASYLSEGFNLAQIARAMNVSDAAVHQYVNRHSYELEVIARSDIILRKKLDYLNHRLIDSMDTKTIDKMNGRDRYIALGIGVEKSRLLSGQSTANISYHDAIKVITDLEDKERKLKQELGIE